MRYPDISSFNSNDPSWSQPMTLCFMHTVFARQYHTRSPRTWFPLMGLDRPIRLSLIFAFASVSIAAIRHLWRISAIFLKRPSSMSPGTRGIRPNTHCLGMYPLCCCTRLFFASVSSSSIVWKSLCDTSMSSTILYPTCRKYLALFSTCSICQCASAGVGSTNVPRPSALSKNPQSETCADQLGDILDFQPISTNLSLSRESRQFDQQFGSRCACLMQHPRCSAPSASSSHEEIP